MMNPDNTHNIFILLLVAVITGFALPALLKGFEIFITRRVNKNAEIRNRQLEITEQFTRIIWEWRFLGKQVCYYGCFYKISPVDEERFRKAITDYNNRVWAIFIEIKTLKSRSIVWFPEIVPEEIETLYEFIKRDVDQPLTDLMSNSIDETSDVTDEFDKMQAFFTHEVSSKIERHIKAIANTISKL